MDRTYARLRRYLPIREIPSNNHVYRIHGKTVAFEWLPIQENVAVPLNRHNSGYASGSFEPSATLHLEE